MLLVLLEHLVPHLVSALLEQLVPLVRKLLGLVVQLKEQHFHRLRRCSWFGCNWRSHWLPYRHCSLQT